MMYPEYQGSTGQLVVEVTLNGSPDKEHMGVLFIRSSAQNSAGMAQSLLMHALPSSGIDNAQHTMPLIEFEPVEKNTEFKKVLGSQFYCYSKYLWGS